MNLRTGKRGFGGSTITQQLCKNLYFGCVKSYRRKLSELGRTFLMERTLSKQKTSTEWNRLAAEFDVALTIMPHYRDMANDEQAWANGYLEKVEYPNGNVDVVPASVFDMGCMERKKTEQAHWIGQDTDEVLASIGMKRPE